MADDHQPPLVDADGLVVERPTRWRQDGGGPHLAAALPYYTPQEIETAVLSEKGRLVVKGLVDKEKVQEITTILCELMEDGRSKFLTKYMFFLDEKAKNGKSILESIPAACLPKRKPVEVKVKRLGKRIYPGIFGNMFWKHRRSLE